MRKRYKISPTQTKQMSVQLFKGRFNEDYLEHLRLNFTTSSALRNYRSLTGYSMERILSTNYFTTPIDPSNEQLVFDFLIQNIDSKLRNLKPKEYYQQRVVELESNLTSIDQFHLLNVCRLQMEESDILKSNKEYLEKRIRQVIRAFYT